MPQSRQGIPARWRILSPSIRIAAGVLLCIVVVGAGYAYWLRPLHSELVQLRSQAPNSLPAEPDSDAIVLSLTADLRAARNSLEATHQRIAKHLDALHAEHLQEMGSVFAEIDRVLADNSLRVLSQKPVEADTAAIPEGLGARATAYRARGDYFSLLETLRALDRLPYLLRVRDVDISIITEGDAPARDPDAPVLLEMAFVADVFAKGMP